MWDVDADTTNAMMNDVGVSYLTNNEECGVVDDDEETRPKPTPPTTLSNDLVPPGVIISMHLFFI